MMGMGLRLVARSRAGVALVIVLAGCASAGGRPTTWPGRERWRDAVTSAVHSPGTWVPALGAALVVPWDRRVSRWAARETPVFGSRQRALDASDHLRTASHVGMAATALLVPREGEHFGGRLQRLLWEEGGAIAATGVTSVLKRVVGRERPDASDDLSFPSGHATRAFAYQAMSMRNLRSSDLGAPARPASAIALGALAAGTAWARVEGGVHFPSDVLAGAAIGNFIAQLVNDAFRGTESTPPVRLETVSGTTAIVFTVRF